MFLKMTTRHQAHKPVKKCNYWVAIFETEWSGGSNCASMPYFVAVGPTVAEIIMVIFRLFKMTDAVIMDF